MNELFDMISSHFSSRIKPKYARARGGEMRKSALAAHKIKEILGFEPKYDLEQGVKKTVGWFRSG